jgi:hypothetical protein
LSYLIRFHPEFFDRVLEEGFDKRYAKRESERRETEIEEGKRSKGSGAR